MMYTQRGVTLLELMIAVAIVGILSAIAYPSYRQQVIKSNRAEAKIGLERRAQLLEKCYTRSLTFVGCAAASGTTPTENGKYAITVSNLTASTYTLTATPQGAQSNDAECRSFTLNNTNTRGLTGSPTGTAADCW